LQERENAAAKTPVFGKKTDNTPQRKHTRPKASSSASPTVDASKFTKLGTMLTSSPSISSNIKSSKSSTASKSNTNKAASSSSTASGFDDDAWEVRDTKESGFDYDNWKIQNRDNED